MKYISKHDFSVELTLMSILEDIERIDNKWNRANNFFDYEELEDFQVKF